MAKQPKLEEVLALRNLGIELPAVMVKFLQEEEWRSQGLKEVWKCPKDFQLYLSPLAELVEVECSSGHLMKKIWHST